MVDNGRRVRVEDVVRGCPSLSADTVRVIREPKPGLHAARNRGWQEAFGQWLAFLDDDARPMPRWLQGLSEIVRDPSVALAGGSCHPDYDVAPPGWLDCFWQDLPEGRVFWSLSLVEFRSGIERVDPFLIFGCNFVVRRDVLETARGFHPDSVPADYILYRGDGESHVSRVVRNHGGRAIAHPWLEVRHRVAKSRMTVEYLERREFLQGISNSYTDIRRTGQPFPWVRLCLRQLRCWLGTVRNPRRTLAERIARGLVRGYLAHQFAARRSAQLREWIARPDYLGQRALLPGWREV